MYAANRSAMPDPRRSRTRVAHRRSSRCSAFATPDCASWRCPSTCASARAESRSCAGSKAVEARGHGREHAPALRGVATPAEDAVDAARRRSRVLGRDDGRTAPGVRGPTRSCGARRRARTTSFSSRAGRAARPRRPRPSSWHECGRRRRGCGSSIAAHARPSVTQSASQGGAEARRRRGRARDVAVARSPSGGARPCRARRIRHGAPSRRDRRARHAASRAPRGSRPGRSCPFRRSRDASR